MAAPSIVVVCKEFSSRKTETGHTGVAMLKTQGNGNDFNFAHIYGFNPEFPLEPGAQYLVTFTKVGQVCA